MTESGEATTTSKRFVLPEDPKVRERLTAAQKVIKELQIEHPEILSFCAFGSTVKGEATRESDLDGLLFVDSTSPNLTSQVDWDPSEDKYPAWLKTSREYYKLFTQKMLSIPGVPMDFKLNHVIVVPVSKDIIDKSIQNALEKRWSAEEIADAQKLPRNNNQLGATDINQPASVIKRSKGLTPGVVLRGLFGLDIGGGLKDLRKYLLDKLESMGEEGDDIWNSIVAFRQASDAYSRRGPIVDKRGYFPPTLKDAREVFGEVKK